MASLPDFWKKSSRAPKVWVKVNNENIVPRGDGLLPCMECDHCHRKEFCIPKDDFESIKKKNRAADGLILASPNPIYSVSARLKAFLNRCCGIVH